VTYSATATDIVDCSVAVTSRRPRDRRSRSARPGHLQRDRLAQQHRNGDIQHHRRDDTASSGKSGHCRRGDGPDGATVTFNTGDEEDDDGGRKRQLFARSRYVVPLGDTLVTCPSGTSRCLSSTRRRPRSNFPRHHDAEHDGDVHRDGIGSRRRQRGRHVYAAIRIDVRTRHHDRELPATDSRDNTATGSFTVEVTTGPVEDPMTSRPRRPGRAARS
jgi:hypothetical protein